MTPTQSKLGDYVSPVRSVNPIALLGEADFIYVDISSVDRELRAITCPHVVPANQAPSRARQETAENDVIVSTVRPNLNTVAVVTDEHAGAIASTGFCVLRAVPGKLDARYLFHWVSSETTVKQLMGLATGATYPAVSDKAIKSLPFAPPSLFEQQRIAAILDKADILRRKRLEAMRLADEFLRAVFVDMFGDPLTNPKEWPRTPVSMVCEDIVDCVNKTAPVVDDPTPYKMIRTTNVRNHLVDLTNTRCVTFETFSRWTQRVLPRRGDIVFTREAPVGEAGIIESDEQLFLGQRTMLYRADATKVTPTYLLYELMAPGVKAQITQASSGSTVKHLSVPVCKEFKVRVPPIKDQRKFELIAKRVRAISSRTEAATVSLNSLGNSLRGAFFG